MDSRETGRKRGGDMQIEGERMKGWVGEGEEEEEGKK